MHLCSLSPDASYFLFNGTSSSISLLSLSLSFPPPPFPFLILRTLAAFAAYIFYKRLSAQFPFLLSAYASPSCIFAFLSLVLVHFTVVQTLVLSSSSPSPPSLKPPDALQNRSVGRPFVGSLSSKMSSFQRRIARLDFEVVGDFSHPLTLTSTPGTPK